MKWIATNIDHSKIYAKAKTLSALMKKCDKLKLKEKPVVFKDNDPAYRIAGKWYKIR